MNDHLHIVCLDAPSPPDYGGAIDMFYKAKALASIGKKIHLHYFDYRRGRNAKSLDTICVSVHAYERKPFYSAFPLAYPFIVQSRINQELISRLNADRHPILLEGLHCSGIIPFINNPERIVLRMHNEEASYYRHLTHAEFSLIKRFYFKHESRLLDVYQQRLDKNIKLACLSDTDKECFALRYGFKNLSFVPCFLPWQLVNIKEGKGNYCLYHGNLLVSENEEAALWLIENVFSQSNVPFVIAGKGISARLRNAATDFKNILLVEQPSIAKVEELVRNAHLNVLPSLNATGVKLKLLNALLNGRHCLTNTAGVKGSCLENVAIVEDEAAKWRERIGWLMTQDFDDTQIETRKTILTIYDNRTNAEKLSALW